MTIYPDHLKAEDVLKTKPKLSLRLSRVLLIIDIIVAILSLVLFFIFWFQGRSLSDVTLFLLVVMSCAISFMSLKDSVTMPNKYINQLLQTETIVRGEQTTTLSDEQLRTRYQDNGEVLPIYLNEVPHLEEALKSGIIYTKNNQPEWSVTVQRRAYANHKVYGLLPKNKREFYTVTYNLPTNQAQFEQYAMRPFDFQDFYISVTKEKS